MSYTAKKTFANPMSVLFAGLFILAGCQGGGDSGIGSESEQGSDTTQEVASQPENPGSRSGKDDPSDGNRSSVDTAATLMWDAPAERENGDALKVGEIDHYIVSWGQDPDKLGNTEEVPCENCTDMEHVVEDLDEGTWYFTVQTRDTEGNVSRQADLATKNI